MPYFPNIPRPDSYPPSPFAAMVGQALSAYGEVKGFQRQAQDAADRKTASDNADRQAQMNEESRGFTRLTMPTVGVPPDQSWESKVGNFLQGGTAAPSVVLMKTGPSDRETEIANEQTYQTGRDTAAHKSASDIEQLRTAIESQRFTATQAGENSRNAASNATRIRAANISAAARGPNTTAGLVHAATGVNQQIMETSRELTAANKVSDTGLSRRASPADSATYNATVGGIPRLIQKRDSLEGVYGGIAARMQGAAGMPSAPSEPGNGEVPDAAAMGADAEHQAIDRNLNAAIASGADPAQAAARADQLHAGVIARHKKVR